MRHLFTILVTTGVLLLPCGARADWTDDFSGTAMSGIWSSEMNVGGGDLSQNGGTAGVLNFTAGGTYADWAAYGSAFSFGLGNDFSARVDYGFDWSPGQQQGAQAGILMRMSGKDGKGVSSFYGMLSTGYLVEYGYYNAMGYNDTFCEYEDGYYGAGWFGLAYDSSEDTLYAGIFTPGATTPFYGNEIEDFSGLVGCGGTVEFSLEGWANYACVGEGQAVLDNFNASSAAPEPVSTALFLIGGATLAARRLRRK